MRIDARQITGALARGYTTEANKAKTLDPDLILAMALEVLKILKKEKPHYKDVIAEIILERFGQDRKWGGPVHDDQHSTAAFVRIIKDYAGCARIGTYHKARRRLVQVAALAIAAVESIDRKLARREIAGAD